MFECTLLMRVGCCFHLFFSWLSTLYFLSFLITFKKLIFTFINCPFNINFGFFDYTSLKCAHFVKIIHLLAVILACLFLIDEKHKCIKIESICRSTESIDKSFQAYSLNVVIDWYNTIFTIRKINFISSSIVKLLVMIPLHKSLLMEYIWTFWNIKFSNKGFI